MKKAIALIMMLLMVASLLAGCVSPQDQGTTTDSASNGSATAAPGGDTNGESGPTAPSTVDENGYLLDDLPKDLNYSNAKVQILNWDSWQPEYEILESEMTGDKVDSAVYKKNLYTEQNLGVDLVFTSTPGDGDHR